MWQWLLVPVAYLIGSLSSAIITSKIMGLPDPRQQGSKNPGATNVLRLGGKTAGMVTLLGDLIKGVLPILIAKYFNASLAIQGAVGLAAFIGHLYPVFFGFKGGKGAATAGGVYYGFSWLGGLAVMSTWIAVAFLSKISSLSALIAGSLAPVYIWYLVRSPELTIASIIMTVILIWRHRSNIGRLLRGEESKIGS